MIAASQRWIGRHAGCALVPATFWNATTQHAALKLALLLLLAFPAAVQAQFTYLAFEGSITITGGDCSGALTIPKTIDGLPVTTIGEDAFYRCTLLTRVVIPEGVTTIANEAFSGCTALTEVAIPDSVTVIGDYAFQGSGLTRAALGTGVLNLGQYAFGACPNLLTLTVSTQNSSFSSVDGVVFDKGRSTLLAYPGGKSGAYGVPDGVTCIADFAFESCNRMTRVTIPDSVKTIGEDAFAFCTNLTQVTIGNGVTNLAVYAFYNCGRMTDLTLGTGIARIGGFAFGGCGSLTNVTFPRSVTQIGPAAFYNCASLTGAYFTGNAPTVSDQTFAVDPNTTVYYLPGTSGWDSVFAGRPTATWTLSGSLEPEFRTRTGVRTGPFGFDILWTDGKSVVVEASTLIKGDAWIPVSTNVINGGVSSFSDPQSTTRPSRFYRLRWQ